VNKKNNDLNILLIGAKGGSVSEGLYKCLKLANYNNVIFLEHTKQAALICRVKKSIITDKNPDDGYEYCKNLIELSLSNKIDVIIPGSNWEAMIIAKYQEDFYRNKLTPLINNLETIEICNDKKRTSDYLLKNGIAVPKSFSTFQDSLQLIEQNIPLIIKPISGRGSQNIFIAKNIFELEAIVKYFDVKKIPYIIQEYIDNDENEYTVGVISDREGNIIQSIAFQRHLFGGATGYAKVIKNGFINIFCENVAKKIESSGPLNVQLRLNKNNEPLVFEINPRFSGSAPMRALAGFNEVDMIIRNFYFHEEIQVASIKYGNEYFRVFQEIEIDVNTGKNKIQNLV
jgi:carbamoyl-phosphate synthase large subunit